MVDLTRGGPFLGRLRRFRGSLLYNNGNGLFLGGEILFVQSLYLPLDLGCKGIAHLGELQNDRDLLVVGRYVCDESALHKPALGLRMKDAVQ